MGLEKDAIHHVLADFDRLRVAAQACRAWSKLAAGSIDAALQQTIARLDTVHARQLQDAVAAHQRAVDQAEQAFQVKVQREVREPIDQAVRFLGILAAPWSDAAWSTYAPTSRSEGPPTFPGTVRIGTLTWGNSSISSDIPAMLPLVGSRSALLCGEGAALERLIAGLQSAALRLVATFPPGTFRLTLVDPVGVGQHLKMFLRLPQAIRRDKVFSETREIEEELRRLLRHVETVTQTRLLDFPTIEQYNAAIEEVSVPYQFLIVVNFPTGFSDAAAEMLLSLAQNGPRTGTYFLASVNLRQPPPHNFDLDNLMNHCTVVKPDGPRFCWNDPLFAAWPLTIDGPPPADLAARLLDASGAASERLTGMGIPFRKVAIPAERRWHGNSTAGLFVDIGMGSTGKPHQFELGSELVHHGLIGGATRMGKTNLLHVILMQLAAVYPPSELQLYLIDFKEGVEFQDYVTYRLPHARVVTIAREPEFGLSVLAELQREIERRGELFRQTGSTTIKEYRQATGQRLPRILLVMDEYQILFGDEGPHSLSPAANAALADLVRRGAAFGIHVLLSSQSPASSFMGNRAAMNQLALRISLRCPEADARLILGESNDAAKLLERPGEAIYNAGNGLPERNVFLQVARLEPDERKRRLMELAELARQPAWQDHLPSKPPVVFEAKARARLLSNEEFTSALADPYGAPADSLLHVWLGEAIEIKPHTAATIERRRGANLLIAGADEETGHALLAAALTGVCVQRAPDAVATTVLMLGRAGQRWSTLFFQLAPNLPGYAVELAGAGHAATVIERILAMVEARRADGGVGAPDHFLVIAGLDRLDVLREVDKYGNAGPIATAFTSIISDGPAVGVHTLAWTAAYSPIERILRRHGAQAFGLRVALTLPVTEANIFLDGPDASRLPPDRALFRDDALGGIAPEKFKPYVLPTVEDLAVIREKLSVRTRG